MITPEKFENFVNSNLDDFTINSLQLLIRYLENPSDKLSVYYFEKRLCWTLCDLKFLHKKFNQFKKELK